jgi:site-specific recombinase XerC
VLRSICKRAVKDEEIERNPVVDVAKPKQQRKRDPRPVAPIYVELLRAQLLDPGDRSRPPRPARSPSATRS